MSENGNSQEKATVEEAGAMGGKARAENLTPQRRREIAKKGADARWGKDLPVATHGDPSKPLKIAHLEIPCYVLSDGKRVLTLRGMLDAMGMKKGSGEGGEGGNRLARFVTGKSVSPHIPAEVREQVVVPLRFNLTGPLGGMAYGYEATILADLCEAVLAAREAKDLMPHQLHIAAQCEILVRAFARVGIIALIDEATGYQDARSKDALAKILEAFVAKELRKWVKTFPTEYYKELFRLRKIPFANTVKRPQYIGHLTNDLVYSRLAPGVLKELQRKNPVLEGRRKHTHHRWLTPDIGHPKLLQHLEAIIALMKAADDWEHFKKMVNKAKPPHQETPLFDLLPDED